MLSGISPFAGLTTLPELLEAKRVLSQRLAQIIPREVLCEDLLVLCRGLISPDPMWRYESAEKADLEGAAPFMTQLVKATCPANITTRFGSGSASWKILPKRNHVANYGSCE